MNRICWAPHPDEIFLLEEVMNKCRDVSIADPNALDLKNSYIKLKTRIIKKNKGKQPPKSLALRAYRYYQHINLATLNRLWQSSVSVSWIFSIINAESEQWKAQKLGYELFSFTISADACFSLFFEEFKCLKDSEPRCKYFEKTHPLYKNYKLLPEVRTLLCSIDQSMSELDELHTVRNKIVHLFLPGSGLCCPEKQNQWLIPKPEPNPKKFMRYYQEMIESDDRDNWFDQNMNKSVCIKDWSRKIMLWLVASISKGWKHLSQQPREWR